MKKILVIRFSSIGDIVLTSPVVRCLKKQIPGCEVHFITKKQFHAVIAANPYIDKCYLIDSHIGEVIPALRRENYDFIVDLHKNFRSAGLRMKLGKKGRSFNKINTGKWLMVNFKINRLPDIHIVDRYFEAVARLGVKNDSEGLDYFIPAEDETATSSLPAPFRKGYIAWVIGGNHHTKLFPEEQVIALANTLKQAIVLIGGPEDGEKGERIVKSTDSAVYNGCGQFSINQSASLVKQAALVLTNDTGMMHIAAAFGKKIVSFWGNTIPQFGMYPYMPGQEQYSEIVEISGLSCRPCSKLGYPECPKKHFDCMNRIDIDEVARKINDLMGR